MAANKPTEELLGESWIELTSSVVGLKSPDRVTPLPFSSGEEYLRLLREAQRESNQSSKVVSLASSRRDTPKGSPKSPPNSPNTELCAEDELKNVYINYWHKEGEAGKDTDWVWSWSSRSDQRPQRDWRFEHPKRRPVGYSIRLARVGRNSLFSKEVLYSLLLTNVLSLLLGTGLGLWLSRRGLLITRVTVE
uniref:Putative conserved plasma membrane protein n=1 Tax=Tabanus bromius TaxID=304241 RepID=A0A0K8TRF2_TABBR